MRAGGFRFLGFFGVAPRPLPGTRLEVTSLSFAPAAPDLRLELKHRPLDSSSRPTAGLPDLALQMPPPVTMPFMPNRTIPTAIKPVTLLATRVAEERRAPTDSHQALHTLDLGHPQDLAHLLERQRAGFLRPFHFIPRRVWLSLPARRAPGRSGRDALLHRLISRLAELVPQRPSANVFAYRFGILLS